MGWFNKKNQNDKSSIETTAVQFDNVPMGTKTTVLCDCNGLEIYTDVYKKAILKDKILDISFLTIDKFANESRFSIGKAAIGTVLFGAIGVIGGLSGKSYIPTAMVISYKNGESEEDIEYIILLQEMPTNNSLVVANYKANLLILTAYEFKKQLNL